MWKTVHISNKGFQTSVICWTRDHSNMPCVFLSKWERKTILVLNFISLFNILSTKDQMEIFNKELNISVHRNATKSWHSYTRCFLFESSRNTYGKNFTHISLSGILATFWQKSTFLLSQSQSTYQPQYKMDNVSIDGQLTVAMPDHDPKFTDTDNNISFLANVTKVSGKIQITTCEVTKHFGLDGYAFKEIDHFYYAWIFSVYPKFRLNVTFSKIYFGGNTDSCNVGSIKFIFLKKMTLCGTYSQMHIFPHSNLVTVALDANSLIPFAVCFSHTVIDDQLLASHQKLDCVSWPYMIFQKIKVVVSTFDIQVEKYKHIALVLQGKLKFLVFDGPGILSPHRSFFDKKVINMSSFQCFLQLCETFDKTRHDTAFAEVVKYFPITAPLSHIDVSQQTKVHHFYTNSSLFSPSNFLKSFHVQTETELQLNLTVLQMQFTGLSSSSCKYGGLAVYDKVRLHSQEANDQRAHSFSLCNTIKLQRNTYSTNSDLLFVGYTYQKYSGIQAQIQLSTTPCKAIKLDLCELHKLDPLYNKQSEAHILSMKNLTKDSGVNLTLDFRNDSWGRRILLDYSLREETCATLHFYQSLTQKFIRLCHAEVRSTAITEPYLDVVYSTTGFLPTFHDNLALYGKPVKFCYDVRWDHHNLSDCEENVPQEMESVHFGISQEWTHSEFGQDVEFFFTWKSRTPTRYSFLKLHVFLSYMSKSWVDFTIRQDKLNISLVNSFSCFGLSYTTMENRIGSSDTLRDVLMFRLIGKFNRTALDFHKSNEILLSADVFILNMLLLSFHTRKALSFWDRIHLEWRSAVYFSTQKTKSNILLPGQVVSALFEGIQQRNQRKIFLNVSLLTNWVQTYSQHDVVRYSQGEICDKENFRWNIWFSYCYNISWFSSEDMNISRNYLSFDMKHSNKSATQKTWSDTLRFCKSVGGSLPSFTAKNELKDFIAINKLNTNLLPQKSLFIGLVTGTTSQVTIQILLYKILHGTFLPVQKLNNPKLHSTFTE